jgi:hypothetical protein
MQLKKFVALGLTALALAAPFASHAETDSMNFGKDYYMKMADKNGMISKADYMKMAERDFDAMSKNGMISMEKMQEMMKKQYSGGGGANK